MIERRASRSSCRSPSRSRTTSSTACYPEETQVPSTNEFAAFHRINPATAGKGVNLLVDEGILYKKRGIGMFVADGARERLVAKRRDAVPRRIPRDPCSPRPPSSASAPTQLTDMITRKESAHERHSAPTSIAPAVQVDGLTKRFGSFTAIDDVSVHHQARTRIYGLLGRNGAGKTTLMQLLTGQDFATAGDIRVFGESPVENARRAAEHLLHQGEPALPGRLPAEARLPQRAAGSSRTGTRTSPSS